MSAVMKPASGAIPLHKLESAAPPERYARGWHCPGLAADFKAGKPHRSSRFGTRPFMLPGGCRKC